MRRGEFIINGITSNSLNSHIQFRPAISAPVRKVQRKSVPGVSENYILDEEAYENTEFTLELVMKVNRSREVNDAKDAIVNAFVGGRYIEFIPYWDSGMTYLVEVIEPPAFKANGRLKTIVPYTVTLSAKPFKYDSISSFYSGQSSLNIINPYYYPVKPVITLYGTGDMNLIVNGEIYIFRAVDTNIIVDSKIESVYRLIGGRPDSRDNRMYTMDFPILESGGNTVSIEGSATRFEVELRWRKLVS